MPLVEPGVDRVPNEPGGQGVVRILDSEPLAEESVRYPPIQNADCPEDSEPYLGSRIFPKQRPVTDIPPHYRK